MFGAAGTGDTSGYGGLVRQAVNFGSSERPYGSYFDEIADDLERAYPDFSDAIERVVVDRGELTLHVKREKLVEVAMILRDKEHRAVGEREHRLIGGKGRCQHMCAGGNRGHAFGERGGGGRIHAARQASTAFSIAARFNPRPIKTIFDWRFSPGFQSLCTSPSSSMWTP